MIEPYFLAQSFSVVAIAFYLVTFQFKARSHILICMSGSALFNACHFFALDNIAAALLALASMSRSVCAYYTTGRIPMLLFAAIALVLFGLSYEYPIQLLLIAASLLATWATFQPKDKTIRLCFMVTTGLWLLHNMWIGTIGGIALETLFLISNILAYKRFYHQNHGSEGADAELSASEHGL